MKELLEAGVHFGHQTKRWNPKMKEYIFGERNGIYIVDLQKTLRLFREALGFANQRWLGGTLTNFVTIQKSIGRFKELTALVEGGGSDLTKKELSRLDKERKKLEKNLSGIQEMQRLPDAIFVVDAGREQIAVHEARKLGIPVIAIVDTNCDPDVVDFVIPGNDDALRAIKLFTSRIAEAVMSGKDMTKAPSDGPSGNGGPVRKTEGELAAKSSSGDVGAGAPPEATPPPA